MPPLSKPIKAASILLPNGDVDFAKAKKDHVIESLASLVVPLSNLIYDPLNARLHPERNLDTIKTSLCRYGQRTPLVVNRRTMHVEKGNGTLQAMRALGWTRGAVAFVDDDDSVAIGYGLTDNRSSDLAKYDIEVLTKLEALQREAGEGLPGFTVEELAALRAEPPPAPADIDDNFEEPSVDVAAELQRKWGTRRGQVWVVGRHRVMCGDATDADDVKRLLNGEKPFLMVTDPPYGVNYNPKWRNEMAKKGLISFAARREGDVPNDTHANIDWRAAWALFPGDVLYCWHDGCRAGHVQLGFEATGFDVICQIIWAKDRFTICQRHYNWQHESAFYAVRKGKKQGWVGGHSQTTLWQISRSDGQDQKTHGTQKPLECMARPIRNHAGDVYDPFVGSGTTVVAAEDLGRRCYAMDIDERYVAVTLERLSRCGLAPILEKG